MEIENIRTRKDISEDVKEEFIKCITEYRELEAKLKLTRISVEMATDILFWATPDASIIDVNDSTCISLGYTREELLQMKIWDFNDNYDIKDWQNFFVKIKKCKSMLVESKLRCKDGNMIPVEVAVNFVHLGSEEYLCSFARNITNRMAIQEELYKAKEAADSSNLAKSQFLAIMSHEIRTPMNGLLGVLQLLELSELTPDQSECVEIAKSSSMKLVHILNDILDLSKIEAGKIELEISDFDLQSTIASSISILSLLANEKGIKLEASIDKNVPTLLKGDAERLNQIILNLVNNAIKFTPSGNINLHVSSGADDPVQSTIRFEIIDSGIGISEAKLDNIFEPFVQADNSTTRNFGGTGLGLAICRRLVEIMGGEIGVISKEGEGSIFWFTANFEKQNGTATHPSTGMICDISNIVGASLLLAEDDTIGQKIISRLLKAYGYRVDAVNNGKEVLRALENNDYSAILMDCMMPEMNGYETTAVIRDPTSPVRWHDIPIIALTGNAMKYDIEYCEKIGMNDHISKPVIIKDLITKLHKLQINIKI